ncbi:hypothetical protein NPIL_518121, partial [Nephila pilipes]
MERKHWISLENSNPNMTTKAMETETAMPESNLST